MGALKAIAESMLIEHIVGRGIHVSQKSKACIALQALAALLLVVALGFLIAAFHAFVAARFAADAAALITAGAVFALAIVAAP